MSVVYMITESIIQISLSLSVPILPLTFFSLTWLIIPRNIWAQTSGVLGVQDQGGAAFLSREECVHPQTCGAVWPMVLSCCTWTHFVTRSALSLGSLHFQI